MWRQGERGCEPRQTRCAWILISALAVTGLTPTVAGAQGDEVAAAKQRLDEAQQEFNAAALELSQAQAEFDAAVEPNRLEAQRKVGAAREKLNAAQINLDEAKAAYDAVAIPAGVEAPPPEDKPYVDPVEPGGTGLMTKEGLAKKIQVSLNDDGSLYFRVLAWLQIWARAMQLNPGSTIAGPEIEATGVPTNQDEWYGDIGIRRARMLMFGRLFPRSLIMLHFGINNQFWNLSAGGNPFKPQLFFHDAWIEFEVVKNKYFDVGAGLIYWNGISRLTNASTITLMTLDGPIVNWPTIELTDQFARHLGVYAKGQIGGFDYRVAVVRPFNRSGGPNTPGGPGTFNPVANTWGYSGYFQYMFLDIEPNVLPYTVGTWIGTKRVFNIGGGFHAQPKGVARINADGEYVEDPLIMAAGDIFLDLPFNRGDKDRGALSAYGVYYYYDMGQDNVRYIGIMNPASNVPQDGVFGNTAGNAYPLLGTGHTGYGQLGYLLPWKAAKTLLFQPYVLTQASWWEAFEDPMIEFGVGANMFIHYHSAKVTLEYRNRPVFNVEEGTVDNRKGNSIILQLHLFI